MQLKVRDRKLKVLVIVTGLKPAGAELMLLRMLIHLDKSRFEIRVISLSSIGKVGEMMVGAGISVEALNIGGVVSLLSGFMKLVKQIKRYKPDVVQTWMYHADLLGGIASKISGVENIIWSIRNSNLSIGANKIATLAVVKICANLSTIIPKSIVSCSEEARVNHIDFGYSKDRFKIVYNGYELNRFKPDLHARSALRKELGISDSELIVGLVGRYHVLKNHRGFIRMAERVAKKNLEVQFVLVGEGVDSRNEELVSAIRLSGLISKFHLLGQRSDIPGIMTSLDILVSASRGEAFPNVIGEAMACGTPCIATDVGESALLIGDTGVVVPLDDMEALSEAVVQMLQISNDDRKRLGWKARERILNYFEIQKISREYGEIYDEFGRQSIVES